MILGVDDRQTLSLLVSRVIGACRQGELGEEGKEGEGRRKERSEWMEQELDSTGKVEGLALDVTFPEEREEKSQKKCGHEGYFVISAGHIIKITDAMP